MTLTTEALTGGFAEPVFQAQSVFKMMMDGMARPGNLQTVTQASDAFKPFAVEQRRSGPALRSQPNHAGFAAVAPASRGARLRHNSGPACRRRTLSRKRRRFRWRCNSPVPVFRRPARW